MRIIVFADTHGDLRGMESVLGKVKPDALIHLGDFGDDINDIKYMYPEIEVHAVHGNCDEYSSYGREKLISAAGKSIYLTHGYQFNLAKGTDLTAPGNDIVTCAAERGADIALFGHTHEPLISLERGVFVLNPGSASLDKNSINPPTFGYIEINGGNITCKILRV